MRASSKQNLKRSKDLLFYVIIRITIVICFNFS